MADKKNHRSEPLNTSEGEVVGVLDEKEAQRYASEKPGAALSTQVVQSSSSGSSNSGNNNQKPPKPKQAQEEAQAAWQIFRRNFTRSLLDRAAWPRRLSVIIFALLSVGALSFALLWNFDSNPVYHQPAGQVAVQDVISPRSLNYYSPILSEQAANAAASNPANTVYKRNEQVVNTQRDQLSNLLKAANDARTDPFAVERFRTQAGSKLPLDRIQAIINLGVSDWQGVREQAVKLFDTEMQGNLQEQQVETEKSRLSSLTFSTVTPYPEFANLDQNQKSIVVALVRPFIVANTALDPDATAKKAEEARKAAPPVSQQLIKGQPIVRKGETLTPLQIEEMEQLGLRSTAQGLWQTVGTVGVIAVLILVLVFYFSQTFSQIWSNYKVLAFLVLALLISAIAMRLLIDRQEYNLRPYLLPLAALAMVMTALLDVQLAILLNVMLAVLMAFVGGTPEYALVFFAGGAAGALSLWKAERTSAFAYAGLAVAVSQFVAGLCYGLVARQLDVADFTLLPLFCLANGLISSSLAFFSFSVLGRLFGVTTVLQLLELAHPNQPLLKRLMREAPGTYQHSMLVATLAEAGAEQLESDALLARVGSYYHDIGKVNRPSYFIDNQFGAPNIHDTLDPRESLNIIRAHVSDGVKLARENHLPNKVVDIIHQHQGTCVVQYFYQKAVQMGLDVTEAEFRYPGPKPQTKIAAIVMMADGCEAAVRATVQAGRIPTGQTPAVREIRPGEENKYTTIRAVVDSMFDGRIRDGQLDECDLTLRDIESLRGIFTETLTSIYHPRVDYQSNAKALDIAAQPGTTADAVMVRTVPNDERPAVAALPANLPTSKLQDAPADGGQPPVSNAPEVRRPLSVNYKPSPVGPMPSVSTEKNEPQTTPAPEPVAQAAAPIVPVPSLPTQDRGPSVRERLDPDSRTRNLSAEAGAGQPSAISNENKTRTIGGAGQRIHPKESNGQE